MAIAFNHSDGLLLFQFKKPQHQMNYKLKIREHEHEEFGNTGAIITNPRFYRDYNDPGNGSTVAHDIIEHSIVPHHDPFIDELMAIGAYSAGRCEYNRYTISGAITSLLNYSGSESWKKGSPYQLKRTIRNKEKLASIRQEVLDGFKNADEVNMDEYDINLMVSWICEGYSRFQTRFKNHSLYDLCTYFFETIQNNVNHWLNSAEEGETATLKVNFSRFQVELIEDD